ncbi:MAG TPA: tetratricopeptide repeat protein [Nitrospiria bacterium]|nr:tetratricopeptide repeat protein [Nitrospiria bacterium]
MSKFLLFALLTMLTGSPWTALLVVLALSLIFDYHYMGVSRSAVSWIKTAGEIRELQADVSLNPHNAAAQNDLGRLLILNGRAREAVAPLERAIERLDDLDETNYYLGLAYLNTGREQEGEARIEKALAINPRFRYGEPYLRLGEHYLHTGRYDDALAMLRTQGEIHTSSVEGLYLLGETHRHMGDPVQARDAYRASLAAFRQSPRYKRREERRWAWRSRLALWRYG